MDKKGLYGKYRIEKADGSPVDPKAIYFTLRLDSDPHAREAIRAYIASCQAEQPELAQDLTGLLTEINRKVHGVTDVEKLLKRIDGRDFN